MEFEINNWKVSFDGKILTIENNGEKREYKIREENTGIEHKNVFGMDYFYIRTTKGFYYQFKLEGDSDFVGDKFTNDDDYIESIACHSFGEEV
jgi:hypothetical protein